MKRARSESLRQIKSLEKLKRYDGKVKNLKKKLESKQCQGTVIEKKLSDSRLTAATGVAAEAEVAAATGAGEGWHTIGS